MEGRRRKVRAMSGRRGRMIRREQDGGKLKSKER
jgi:hypothetical protein